MVHFDNMDRVASLGETWDHKDEDDEDASTCYARAENMDDHEVNHRQEEALDGSRDWSCSLQSWDAQMTLDWDGMVHAQ